MACGEAMGEQVARHDEEQEKKQEGGPRLKIQRCS
jgi:hypothetical protein